MNISFSVPSGYHIRELLLPLKTWLEQDNDIREVQVITPAASDASTIFPDYKKKFTFITNPSDEQKSEQLFANSPPNLLITNTSGLDPSDPPLLRAAKKHHIPTLTFVSSWDNVWKIEKYKQRGLPLELADYLIVWNTMMRDHYLRIFPDLSPERIAIIGAPRLDFFFHRDQIPDTPTLRRYLDLPLDGKLIHFATTELYPMDYLMQSVIQAQKSRHIKEKVHMYASVHPGGDITKHAAYAKKYGITLRYSFGRRETAPHPDFRYNPTLAEMYMLVSLFTHADILINHSSTVAIESFLGDTPVINVKYGRPLDWWRWRRSVVFRDFTQHYLDITKDNATKVVKNHREFINAITTYLAHPDQDQAARRHTLKRMITTTVGTASEKVLDLIKKIAA